MNCPNCGSINNGGTFCNNCGKSLIQNNNVNQNMVQGEVNGVNPQVTNYGASTQSINQNINVNSNQVGLQTMISNQRPAEESFEINESCVFSEYKNPVLLLIILFNPPVLWAIGKVPKN